MERYAALCEKHNFNFVESCKTLFWTNYFLRYFPNKSVPAETLTSMISSGLISANMNEKSIKLPEWDPNYVVYLDCKNIFFCVKIV